MGADRRRSAVSRRVCDPTPPRKVPMTGALTSTQLRSRQHTNEIGPERSESREDLSMTPSKCRRSARAVLFLASLVSASSICAASASATSHPTRLTVTSTQIGPGALRVKQTSRVRCAPLTGSTVPRPVSACRTLARYPGMLRPAAPASGPCAIPRYWIDVSGTRDGRAINVSFRSCVGVQGTMIRAWLSLLR